MQHLAVVTGNFFFRHRNWAFPVLVAGLFAVASPPSTIFGSEAAEEIKDGFAILVVLAGLSLRGMVIGQRYIRRSGEKKTIHATVLFTTGLFSLCRNPLYTGNVLIVFGILLMHGNMWVMLIGATVYMLIYSVMVRAEEDYLQRHFGAAYDDYCARVPRWVPNPFRLGAVQHDGPFSFSRVLIVEYPNIGIAVLTLALTEFYEQATSPPDAIRLRSMGLLLGIAVVAIAWMIVMRVLKKRHILIAP